MLNTTYRRNIDRDANYCNSFNYSREGCYTFPLIEWWVVEGVITIVITYGGIDDDIIGTVFKVDAEIEPSDFSSLEHAKSIHGLNMDDVEALQAYTSLVAKDLFGCDIATPTTTEECLIAFKHIDWSMKDILQHIKSLMMR